MNNVGSLYLHVAERKGFFAREGIKLESVMIEGGTDRMVAAIDEGKVDLAHSSTPYLISAVLKGSNAVGIAGEVGNPVYTLIVRPEITSYADLRGKVIALSVAADTISITTRKLLAKHGVKDGEAAAQEGLGIVRKLANADPANTSLQRDIYVFHTPRQRTVCGWRADAGAGELRERGGGCSRPHRPRSGQRLIAARYHVDARQDRRCAAGRRRSRRCARGL